MTDRNRLYSGMQTVAENHIDSYIYAAEIHGGFRSEDYAPGMDRSAKQVMTAEYNTMILACEGSMSYRTGGQMYHIISPGIHVVPAGTAIKAIFYSDNFHGGILEVCNELIMDIFRNNNPFPLNILYRLSMVKQAAGIAPDSEECACLLDDIRDIMAVVGKKDHHFLNELSYAHLYIFTADLADIIWKHCGNGASGHTAGISRPDTIFRQFLELLEENIENEYSVDFYVKRLYISKQYLSMIVKMKTGATIGKVISGIRAEKAIHMLSNTDLSIKEIAYKLSFPDQSSFGKFFKKQYGKSPSVYRAGMVRKPKMYPGASK